MIQNRETSSTEPPRYITFKPKKIGRFDVDVLGVYTSNSSNPISADTAMKLVEQKLKSNKYKEIYKCKMQVYFQPNKASFIVLKSRVSKKHIVESFTITAMQMPKVGQIVNHTFVNISVIFLAVLNKLSKWDLFVIHPIGMDSQDLVIKLTQLIKNNQMESATSTEINDLMSNGTSSPAHSSKQMQNDNLENDGSHSIYSLSSTFVNTWQSKMDNINASSSSFNDFNLGNHSDLYVLNGNMKEIRRFMNNLFIIIKTIVEKKNQNNAFNGQFISNGEINLNLPEKLKFIEIIQKIKQSLNICAENESLIYNPDAPAISNYLFIYLRILGDATLSRSNGRPELVSEVVDPSIVPITVELLKKSLNLENRYYWSILGPNFGFNRDILPMLNDLNEIDEFHIRREFLSDETIKRRIHMPSNYQENHLVENHRTKSFDDLEYLNHVSRPSPRLINSNYAVNNHSAPVSQGVQTPVYRYKPESHIMRQHMTQQSLSNNSRHSPNNSEIQMNNEAYLTNDYFHSDYKKYLNASDDNLDNIIPRPSFVNSSCSTHVKPSVWNDRQCRFIDSVLLRNGKLAHSINDRSAHNANEVGVSKDEIVEVLNTHSSNQHTKVCEIRNAFGNIGLCPLSILNFVEFTQHKH